MSRLTIWRTVVSRGVDGASAVHRSWLPLPLRIAVLALVGLVAVPLALLFFMVCLLVVAALGVLVWLRMRWEQLRIRWAADRGRSSNVRVIRPPRA
jgi:hypothetical protein